MGKRKYNEKGRQVKNIVIDDSDAKQVRVRCSTSSDEVKKHLPARFSQIKLDIDGGGGDEEYGGYDQSNALVLPSKKRDTKVQKTEEKHITRILSKKQRKNLEKIVDKKKKKESVSK